jgi:hypothetical protein
MTLRNLQRSVMPEINCQPSAVSGAGGREYDRGGTLF